jgi:uncharacterized membrane protein
MRFLKWSLGFLLSLALLAAQRAHARPVTYTSIDVPGAAQTVVYGINAAGEIVGYYKDAFFTDGKKKTHGFILSGGVFTTVDVPGALGVELRGISPGGDVVGDYWKAGEPATAAHGFLLRRNGAFVPIEFPLRPYTYPQRILPDGTILGCYHENDMLGSMFGMWIRGDRAEAILQSASMHNGATPDLRIIVGSFTDLSEPAPRSMWAYVIEDGVFTRFRLPGAIMTTAWDVTPEGVIVGTYRDAKSATHGFLLENGTYTTIDFPGAPETRAWGMNANGDVVGYYVDPSGGVHGFLRQDLRVLPQPDTQERERQD